MAKSKMDFQCICNMKQPVNKTKHDPLPMHAENEKGFFQRILHIYDLKPKH
ncbi:hypothetical protein Hanom_Chr09g00836031 [Helianthus anomalus]